MKSDDLFFAFHACFVKFYFAVINTIQTCGITAFGKNYLSFIINTAFFIKVEVAGFFTIQRFKYGFRTYFAIFTGYVT
jgi:hypothetical protein